MALSNEAALMQINPGMIAPEKIRGMLRLNVGAASIVSPAIREA
ncbi:hypothetical protein AB4Z52_34170 [Rhizobium sp. 2YAF20]